jgi:DNA-binding beta-propeller fold protein YncE
MQTSRLSLFLCSLAAIAVLLSGNASFTQEKKEEKKATPVTPRHLVKNLENPSGIAVHETTGHVFVASRHGVYRYNPDTHAVSHEIANSVKPTGTYGKGTYETSSKFDIGPLGLAFLNKDFLVVGDGSRADGEELVLVYEIEAEPAKSVITEAKAVHTLGPIKAGDLSAKGEGNFYGVAVGADAIFVTSNGDDTKGWVAKSEIKDGKPGTLTPSIATKEATEVDAPVAITFSLDGKELVVGQMGEMNVAGDALLTTYDPKTGKLKKKYSTGLSDIAGLAYSPKTKKLYATDFAWLDSTKEKAEEKTGGLYELTIKDDKVEAKKILALDKPAAIAFSKDGSKLYLTTFGTHADPKADRNDKNYKSSGSLYVIEAGL